MSNRDLHATVHRDLLHQVGGQAWLFPIQAPERNELFEIGALGGLTVWSACGTPGEIRALARKLCRRGRLGLLFATSNASGELLVAVTVDPVVITRLEPSATPLILARVALAASVERESLLDRAIACSDALDIDAGGRAAFQALRTLLTQGIDTLPANVPRPRRHAWVLLQLTRLLFLRFVESEGWLDNNSGFLADRFADVMTRRLDPTRHFLHPLYFGTLNLPTSRRSRLARGFGAIPFLNGGLFEPHPLERHCRLALPRNYWRDAFHVLVERIVVSLDADDTTKRVTPEMLGRVFEGVMDPAERRRDGAFFTPPALVDALLHDTLACHLAPRLNCSEREAWQRVADPDANALAMLGSLRVLDPAAGSGAFLVGALKLLHGPGERSARRTRMLVSRRLFGVDRNPAAVRIAELRLWLEVLRSMRNAPVDRVAPLPNLDVAMRTGNALTRAHGEAMPARDMARLITLQRAISRLHGTPKRRALRRLRKAELVAARNALDGEAVRLDWQIRELIEGLRNRTLFGSRTAATAAGRAELARLRQERVALRQEVRRIRDEVAGAAFTIEAAFVHVMQRGGFDLIIGNPPWVRGQRLPPSTRERLSRGYEWWRTAGSGAWGQRPDLAVAFIERAFRLLTHGGTFALLVPVKLATVSYGTACRRGLVSHATLHHVADLADDTRAGFDATVYPMALIASRRRAVHDHRIQLALGGAGASTAQSEWAADGNSAWMLHHDRCQQAVTSICCRHEPLAPQLVPQLGVKTGANEVFLDPPGELTRYTRAMIRGRDVGRFRANASARILWPADSHGVPWRELPLEVAEYLRHHRARLERRSDMHDDIWWRLFRTGPGTAEHRVVWTDLSRRLGAAWLIDRDIVPLNSCYVIATPSAGAAAALCAWLNSRWIGTMARLRAEPAANGYARFGARAVGSVPLAASALDDASLIELGARASRGESVDAEIDERVAQLLELTFDERAHLDAVPVHRC